MKNRANHFQLNLINQYRYLILIIFLGVFFSCAKKLYQKNDYTFYKENFKLDASSALRTDGVYVLDHTWTDENGGTTKLSKEHRFYKFYESGQCNLTLDLSDQIKTNEDYINAVSEDFLVKKNTLFEGYYILENDKIVIQRAVVPRQQFEYKYGYIKKDSIIFVSATIHGKGKFHDKYFTETYKEYYFFRPLEIKNDSNPQW